MEQKKITVFDGIATRQVAVDADRFSTFDNAKHVLSNLVAVQGRDANEVLSFLVSQLAYTESTVYERQYQPLQYEKFLPLDFSAGEYATSIRYEIMDYVGQGRRISGKAQDVPKVDVAYAQREYPVALGGIGYDYTQEELRQTAFLRRPLSSARLMAAMEAYQRHMNQVGLYGESASNFTGLFNNAGVPQGNAPSGTWGSATPDQILADINTLIENIWNNTQFNDMPTDIVMAPNALSKIANTARATSSDTTILKFIKENNIAKLERGVDINFSAGYGLNTAGVGSTRRMMGYVKSPLYVKMHIPMPLRFLAPQLKGYGIDIPGEYKYAGVEIARPKSAYYMDNI
jgi:hypothetical protein